jgi:hypothetical protein
MSVDFQPVPPEIALAVLMSIPTRKSLSGSKYWDTKDGVYRYSNHWGMLRNDFYGSPDDQYNNEWKLGYAPNSEFDNTKED